MSKIQFSKDIFFEPCNPTQDQAALVMQWRNDPVTLQMSYHSSPKIWKDFWPEFQKTYFSVHVIIHPVFALFEGKRIAFLKFSEVAHPQKLSGLTVEISLNLAPDMRGQGLGSKIYQAAVEYLAVKGVESVYAEVLAHNQAGMKALKNAGFSVLDQQEKYLEDTGRTHTIQCFLMDIMGSYWRRKQTYLIAEAGSNWRMGTFKRDLAMARTLIDIAVEARADAVKFQTYKPHTTYVRNAGSIDYLNPPEDSRKAIDVYALFADLAMPYDMLGILADYCKQCKIDFMSTPFSPPDFKALDPFVAVHKIASYEISHIHLLRLAAKSGKPLILSTGASQEEDIAWAVETFQEAGGKDLCLLQCTAKYPAPLSSLNLKVIPWLRQRFRVASGLSDHSRHPTIGPTLALALGAKVIEKHFTLDNRLPGPDHAFAVTAHELKQFVQDIRMAEEALGDGKKNVLAEEEVLAQFARRGLQATNNISVGERLCEGENYEILRPGQQRLGLHPRYLEGVEGRYALKKIQLGEGIFFEDITD